MIMGLMNSMERKILVSFVYAKCYYYEQRQLWLELNRLPGLTMPWVVMGDFNCIREDMECIGEQPRSLVAIEEFNNCK